MTVPLIVRRSIIATLCAVGISAGITRAIELTATRVGPAPNDPVISEREQTLIDTLSTAFAVERSSARYRETLAGTLAFTRKYLTYPSTTLLHVVPGAIVLFVAPLQFSPYVRRRYITFHRWSGRALLLIVLATSLSAFFLGVTMPYGGLWESLAAMTFGGIFLYAGARAFIAIRRGDVTSHREWMIRMFAAALGIATMRVIFGPIVALAPSAATMPQLFDISLWAGWLITLAIAEAWIRYTRSRA